MSPSPAVPPRTPVKREPSDDEDDVSLTPSSGKKKVRRSKIEKGNKGLRHFSMKVCQKVQEKNVTTYNEVADELVTDITSAGEGGDFDQKNIRRRVYDALNVLMAMEIISKFKKEIRWIGLPTNSQQELESLTAERAKLEERLSKKRAHLQELVLQQIAVQNLVKRNEKKGQEPTTQYRIQLPFIIVNTDKDTVIECEMAEDRSKYFFNFNKPFEIHDDLEILKRMGLTVGLDKCACSKEELERAKTLLPAELVPYLEDMAAAPQQQTNNNGANNGAAVSQATQVEATAPEAAAPRPVATVVPQQSASEAG